MSAFYGPVPHAHGALIVPWSQGGKDQGTMRIPFIVSTTPCIWLEMDMKRILMTENELLKT